jgi:hypothetical protein
MTMCTPVPWTAQLIAAERSPSVISLILAPVARTSAMSSAWRGRSRMMTVMSCVFRPRESATRPTFSAGGRVMSTLPAAPRADAQLLEIRVRRVDEPAPL